MKKSFAITLAGILLASFAVDAAAHGRRHGGGHSRSHFSIHFGGPLWWGPGPIYRPYPYYYEPRTIIIEREPPVYIQRQPSVATPSALPQQVWYYCTDPAGYYPYIQNCTQAWVSVDPRTIAPPHGR